MESKTRYTALQYDIEKYPFIEEIEKLFNTDNISDLHLLSEEQYKSLFEVGKDSSTVFHKLFYDKFRAGWPELVDLYNKFISEFVSKSFDEDFLFQSFPTFRVHLPNNIAVGAFHNDAQFNHPKGEINFVIPITSSEDTASIWVESEPSKEDFDFIILEPGFLVKFNGNELTHGNKVNETGRTRVSMDFRILPYSCYIESNTGESITTNTKFKEGEYYTKFSKQK